MSIIPKAVRRWLILRGIRKALERVMPRAAAGEIMGGWKTWTGGLGFIVGGLGQILATINSGEWDFKDIQAGIALIASGFSVLGVGHKIEKAAASVSDGE